MNASRFEYIRYRIERSDETYRDAKLLADNHRWRSCINRLYYSTFHLITALLSLDGFVTKSHAGLKTRFLQLYIKTHLIEAKYGQLYSKLADWRQESDYTIYVEFEDRDIMP
ncbi:MAG: HEPN domain-containing protein [Bacteroidales bacterium]|nr:HEPN domain-containing protein [Bacteroidales bacterium]